MIEIIMSGMNFGAAPREDGGKNITYYHAKTDTAYIFPFQLEPLGELRELLAMPNDELAALNAKRLAEQNGATAVDTAPE